MRLLGTTPEAPSEKGKLNFRISDFSMFLHDGILDVLLPPRATF